MLLWQPEEVETMRGLLTSILFAGCALTPASAAIVGYTDDFNGDIGEWGGGSSYELVTTGGVGGVGDGYLRVYNEAEQQLSVRHSGAEFTGSLAADGVTGFSFWLSDLGTDDNLEIHIGIGSAFLNRWQYNVGFTPPTDGWAMFTVDFSDPSNWTRIFGTGTFEEALAFSDRLQFRHDNAPFEQFPDFAAGDFGLDRVTVLPEPASLTLLAAFALVLRRRA